MLAVPAGEPDPPRRPAALVMSDVDPVTTWVRTLGSPCTCTTALKSVEKTENGVVETYTTTIDADCPMHGALLVPATVKLTGRRRWAQVVRSEPWS
jgi:hypothetical protein